MHLDTIFFSTKFIPFHWHFPLSHFANCKRLFRPQTDPFHISIWGPWSFLAHLLLYFSLFFSYADINFSPIHLLSRYPSFISFFLCFFLFVFAFIRFSSFFSGMFFLKDFCILILFNSFQFVDFLSTFFVVRLLWSPTIH